MTKTASHFEVRTETGSDYCDTMGIAQDVADALDYRGIAYTTYVHFTDGTFRPAFA